MLIAALASGQIQQTVNDPVPDGYADVLRNAGLRVVEVDEAELSGDLHLLYLDAEDALVPRPTCSAAIDRTVIRADGEDAAVLSGLPDPCALLINGMPRDVAGGSIEIRSRRPGTFLIQLQHWPLVDWSVTVEAEA
ncbi:hypothetical protein [Aureimonas leprariae]|uniref:Uncharacterized protein n=1 Tax=Plantimonas leprariae TaxID=2615207 RepID=A0A7V7TY73_9HYPH|nr:hypothetical protein [Aureimonas leprariae]KAB0682011.1 hypothetical protein F6X38_04180 [Aureimonas leprariae]